MPPAVVHSFVTSTGPCAHARSPTRAPLIDFAHHRFCTAGDKFMARPSVIFYHHVCQVCVTYPDGTRPPLPPASWDPFLGWPYAWYTTGGEVIHLQPPATHRQLREGVPRAVFKRCRSFIAACRFSQTSSRKTPSRRQSVINIHFICQNSHSELEVSVVSRAHAASNPLPSKEAQGR